MNKVSMIVGKPVERYVVRITAPCGNFDFELNSSMEVLTELLIQLREFLACSEEEHRNFERVRAILLYAMTFENSNLDSMRNIRGNLEEICISFDKLAAAEEFAAHVPFEVLKHLDDWNAKRMSKV